MQVWGRPWLCVGPPRALAGRRCMVWHARGRGSPRRVLCNATTPVAAQPPAAAPGRGMVHGAAAGSGITGGGPGARPRLPVRNRPSPQAPAGSAWLRCARGHSPAHRPCATCRGGPARAATPGRLAAGPRRSSSGTAHPSPCQTGGHRGRRGPADPRPRLTHNTPAARARGSLQRTFERAPARSCPAPRLSMQYTHSDASPSVARHS